MLIVNYPVILSMEKYDVIVIGAGHAGCEAALASARLGAKTALLTMHTEKIAEVSCNPSIGGVGKGQLVKEIDALGGEMAKAADATAIHFRMLNRSRGPAVWSSRAQIDRHKYSHYMQDAILPQSNLEVIEDEAVDIVVENNRVCGVKTKQAHTFRAHAIVLTPGTFLNGLIHIGLKHHSGGRYGEEASKELSSSLKRLGLEMSTLKTGTTPRIKKDSIDFNKLRPQPGDDKPIPFSFKTTATLENKALCHIAYTNPKTHSIIGGSLDRSPLYTGIIKSTGVRYCPSIEDKIVRFPDRQRHQVFLEPEGLDTDWYYPNGLSTSLPIDVQNDMLHSIEGLENTEIIRPGYGIEYEFVQPTQLFATLQVKRVAGLYLAGQVNGTTGYEEAASQGLVAGINAALKSIGKEPLVLSRRESYIGVLIDDLITKGTTEPYRMFTSRVEYRLTIREDNADLRLRKYGYKVGLVSEDDFKKTESKRDIIDSTIEELKNTRIKPTLSINKGLEELGTPALNKVISAAELLRRPKIEYQALKQLDIIADNIPCDYERIVELLIKYDGFIKRQIADMQKMQDIEKIRIPNGIDFSRISGLSSEIVEKLNRVRPASLAQASRISGVTPAAIMLLMVYLKKCNGQSRNSLQANRL
ncbi:MAG: tRNA uridine-5-carboxymethylaminomethyl(34) synthesis enzyme MnmG [Candidatus Omnitrophica bacterium]|nr:tRNA uridine-5-carboxymethylaminomethyl(34) synthesis enzyme MnmG [Candidatus Omnitrophota bacterium]